MQADQANGGFFPCRTTNIQAQEINISVLAGQTRTPEYKSEHILMNLKTPFILYLVLYWCAQAVGLLAPQWIFKALQETHI